MFTILLVIYLLVAVGVIGLVLIQQGKGADMGASFGAGASNTVFGSGGSGNFLTRMTAIFATVFFVISLVLGNLTAKQTAETGLYDDLSVTVSEEVIEADDSASKQAEIPN